MEISAIKEIFYLLYDLCALDKQINLHTKTLLTVC